MRNFFMRRSDTGSGGGRRRTAKLGLALGAGAARGWAHIGFLQELDAHNIRADVITGTSIGAVCGGAYAGGKLIELEAFARSLTKRRIFSMMDVSLAGGGLIGGSRLRAKLEEAVGNLNAEDLAVKFGAVATEIGSGHEVWLTKGNMAEAIRASYALPGLFEPVNFHGRWMVDGALVNPVPVTLCRALGADLVVAVNLSTDSFARGSVKPDEYEDAPQAPVAAPPPNLPEHSSSRGFLRAVSDGAFALSWPFRAPSPQTKTTPASGPGVAAVMIDAFNIMQDRVARSRLAGDPPDILVNAKVGKVGLFEFHRADELIALGREAARRSMDDIRAAQASFESYNF